LLKNLILFAGLLLMLLNANLYEFSEQLQLKVFIVGIIIFGIPHGGADRLVASKNLSYQNKQFSKFRFNLVYLGNVGLISLLLICFPVLGFTLFLFLSAYHFGESDLHALSGQKVLGKIVTFNYGVLILGVIFLPEFKQVQAGIESLHSNPGSLKFLGWITAHRLEILTSVAILFILNSFIYFYYNRSVFKASYVQLLQNTVLILILYKLPLLLSFSFYFLFWHSMFSLKNILRYLLKDNTGHAAMVYKEIAINSGIATAGIVLFGLLGYNYSQNQNLIVYAVSGLAVLTASHMQIMHQMYQNLRSSRAIDTPSFEKPREEN
jgi:Brp/Blh family beta-carotene 15,15'-monooxygenase